MSASHWLLDSIAGQRARALRDAADTQAPEDLETAEAVTSALDLAVLDLELDSLPDDSPRQALLREAAADAFRLLRRMPLPDAPIAAAEHLLRAAALAAIGDQGADAALWLHGIEVQGRWPKLPTASANWGERCRATLADFWLCVAMRTVGVKAIPERFAALIDAQLEFERGYLRGRDAQGIARSALELIAIYHLAAAAAVMAKPFPDGSAEHFHSANLLAKHFDRAIAAARSGALADLDSLARLLAFAAPFWSTAARRRQGACQTGHLCFAVEKAQPGRAI